MLDILQAFILGIVEGLTEFVPVSSTGHLIVFGNLLGFNEKPYADTFEVVIQLGAILAVVFLYLQRFIGLFDFKAQGGMRGYNGLKLLAITSIPAFILGFLGHDFIKKTLFNPLTVAIGLAVGGVALILIERVLPKAKNVGLDTITPREALIVGLFQCLALWPGTSRSAATIVGGMLSGVDRKTAAEYSFFAAVPVMIAASAYDMLKGIKDIHTGDLPVFAVGFVVAFIFSFFSVKYFIAWVGRTSLAPFGYYRLVVAALIVALIGSGVIKL